MTTNAEKKISELTEDYDLEYEKLRTFLGDWFAGDGSTPLCRFVECVERDETLGHTLEVIDG